MRHLMEYGRLVKMEKFDRFWLGFSRLAASAVRPREADRQTPQKA